MPSTNFIPRQTPIVAEWLNEIDENVFQAAGAVANTVARTAQEKFSDVVSVLDFGAVGDGVTDDGPALLLAVASGKDVFLPAGYIFKMDNTTLTPNAGQQLLGPGRLRKTVVQPGYVSTFIKILSVDRVTVDGVEFECVGSSREYGVTIEDSDSSVVRNCRFVGNETPVFVYKNSNNTAIVGNWISGGQQGIATGGDAAGNTNGPVTNTVIAYNFISGCDQEGIDINWDTQRCLIHGNTLVGNGVGTPQEEMDIGGGECFDIIVTNNVIDGNNTSLGGILIKKNPTITTKRVIVSGNTIKNLNASDSSSRGIRFTNSVEGVISHNIIDDAYTGISIDTDVSDVVVANNYVKNCQSRGIAVSTGTNTNIRISGNIVKSAGLLTTLSNLNRTGIYLDNCTGVAIENNSVLTCGADVPTGAGAYGFGIALASTATRVAIKGNEVSGCGNSGINLSSLYIQVLNNIVYLNGSAGINTTGDYCTFIGNTIYDNAVVVDASYGLQVGTGADFNVINANQIFDTRGGSARQNGLRFVGAADRLIVTSNFSYNNKTTNITGTGSLTASVVADNITA